MFFPPPPPFGFLIGYYQSRKVQQKMTLTSYQNSNFKGLTITRNFLVMDKDLLEG